MIKFQNLDANESIHFSRQLEYIKSQTYDIVYPQYKATLLIPVSNEAGDAAESITYRQYDAVGMMKLISDYADDLPRSDVYGKEFTTPVRSVGGSYGYSVQEIRASLRTGSKLKARKAAAARAAWESFVNRYGFLADGTPSFGGLYGLLFNPNTTKITATTGTWGTATAAQIVADITIAVAAIRTNTKGVEDPNTIIMPIAQYTRISTLVNSAASDLTVLNYLKQVFPGMRFEWANEMDAVVNSLGNKPSGTAGATDVAAIFDRNSDKLTYEIPQPFEQFDAQPRNLEFVVPTHGRIGGVIVYYPLSVVILEGV